MIKKRKKEKAKNDNTHNCTCFIVNHAEKIFKKYIYAP